MAVAFRAAATIYNTSANSLTCNKPTGTVDGDVMLAIAYGNSPIATITPPAGWTLLDSVTTSVTAIISLYYKVASSEGASYVWGFDATNRCRVTIASFSGASATINAHAAQGNASSYYMTAPTITPTKDNCMIVLLGAADSGSNMAPISTTGAPEYTEAYESSDGDIHDIQTLTQTTAAATGERKAVMTSQAATAGFHVALAQYVAAGKKIFGTSMSKAFGIIPAKVYGV